MKIEETGWTLAIEGAVARLTLARPNVANALDDATIGAGVKLVTRLSVEPGVRVVVLAGEGKHFCAGGDIAWMKRSKSFTPEQNRADAHELAHLLYAIHTCPRPVVARIHGSALGAGAGLTAASDVAVAADSAVLGFTEVRLGLVPAVISPYVLRRLTPGAAQARFLTGARFPAAEALRIGLVDRVVPASELDEAVEAVAAEMLAGPDEAHQIVKEIVARVAGRQADAVLEFTVETLCHVRVGREAQEGFAAFLEHRKPSWQP
jgi:methylglutaconyl-CoA hydratase